MLSILSLKPMMHLYNINTSSNSTSLTFSRSSHLQSYSIWCRQRFELEEERSHLDNEKVILDDTELTNKDLQAFDPEAHCPLHPYGHHRWQDCSIYKHHFTNCQSQQMIDSLILSPSPELFKEMCSLLRPHPSLLS